MRAGQLRHPVTIQSFTTVADEYGSKEKTWVEFKPMRAAIWPQKTKEVEVNGKLVVLATSTIRVRYIPGVTPSMRVKFGERIFEILGIKNFEERNQYLDLMCRENA